MALDYGAVVSLTGYDVKTATLQQLGYSSKYPLFKVSASGTISVTVAVAPNPGLGQYAFANASFNHALGYIPMFRTFGYTNPPTNTQKAACDYICDQIGGVGTDLYIHARATSSNLTIYAANTDGSNGYTISVFYYIYVDPGS